MEIVQILFTMIVALHGARGLPNPQAHEDRLQGVALDMYGEGQARPIFVGEAAPEATALALYAVAAHESGFWSKVQDCSACYIGSRWCDQGRSVSLYQLQGPASWGPYSREELCSDNANATRRARAVLARHRKAGSSLGLFIGYSRTRQVGEEMNQIFAAACRKAGVVISHKEGHLRASFAKCPLTGVSVVAKQASCKVLPERSGVQTTPMSLLMTTSESRSAQ
jgi:hypothetical protein